MTGLRAIPNEMDPAAVAGVDVRLDEIVREHGVHIALAVESGSRAWGFPSPDSDYDGRFLFVRPADQHLTLWPRRNVIETPLDGELDVGGWELGKALKLLLGGNAVIIEWLTSPIVYRGVPWVRDELLAFAMRAADRGRIASHYLHLGRRQRAVWAERGDASIKKVFYTLRPAVALRWLRLHPESAVAPMHFPTLLAEAEPPPEVAALTTELIARKAVTRELGTGVMPEALLAFIDAEFKAAAEVVGERWDAPTRRAHAAEADGLYREITRRLDGESSALVIPAEAERSSAKSGDEAR